jgi:hypothetical protein
MMAIRECVAHREWSDVCFQERENRSFSRSVQGRIYSGPENKCAPRLYGVLEKQVTIHVGDPENKLRSTFGPDNK